MGVRVLALALLLFSADLFAQSGIEITRPSRTIPAGLGTGTYLAGGRLTCSATILATGANTTETDLWTYTLPANTLGADGTALKVIAFGTTAANANVKTIRGYWGSNSYVVNPVTTSPNAGNWVTEAIYIRSAAAAQASKRLQFVAAVPQSLNTSNGALTENFASTIVIKITGQNGTAAAGDITFQGACVELLP